jgi:hypothetical protein
LDTLYVAESSSKALLTPSLPFTLATKSSIYSLHAQGMYPANTWQRLFDMIWSNAVASSPNDNFATEDSARQVLEESLRCANPTPKRIKLVRSTSAFESSETNLSSFVKEVLRGLETAEVELTKMRTGLTVFSSLVGQPSSSENPGSAWAAVEQT